jgi:hypothetical protein
VGSLVNWWSLRFALRANMGFLSILQTLQAARLWRRFGLLGHARYHGLTGN